jgi:hypothetical protein
MSGPTVGAMVFFDRLRFGLKRRRERGAAAREERTAEARRRERAGDLDGAIEAYLAAGLPNGAARVLLLRASAEPSAEKRLLFCEQAARIATLDKLRAEARARAARIELDVLRADGRGVLASELTDVARRLEACGELGHAAEAYMQACRSEDAVRVLERLGVMDDVGDVFAFERDVWTERKVDDALRRVADLDAKGERSLALRAVRGLLREIDAAPETRDEYAVHVGPLVAAARVLRAQLLSGPVVDLEIEGLVRRFVLGSEVVVGQDETCALVSWSSRVSRRHLRVARGPHGIFVEDLGSRNGTVFANGARLTGPVLASAPLALVLGDAPCLIEPAPPGVTITLSGARRYYAPLGDFGVCGWRLGHDPEGPYVTLVTPRGFGAPYQGERKMAPCIQLRRGDALSAEPGGPVLLHVPANSDVFA